MVITYDVFVKRKMLAKYIMATYYFTTIQRVCEGNIFLLKNNPFMFLILKYLKYTAIFN